MLILNAGVPRSGTVLVNAIIRALLSQAGVGSFQANPHGRELPTLVQRLRRSGEHRHKAIVVHTHSWDIDSGRMLATDPHVVAFANYRDPRDVCVSLMKLHDISFDDAATSVLQYFPAFEATVDALDAMTIPYEMLVAATDTHVFQIARRLGLWPTFEQVAKVVDATSMDRHRQVMDEVNAGTVATVAERQNRMRVLREDRTTLINDRHIQSGASGRWREELTEAQQAAVNERFALLLQRYGYET